MKKNGQWILLIVLVVLIGGAYVLYNRLSEGRQNNLMVREESAGNDENRAQDDSIEKEEQAEEEDAQTGEEGAQAEDEGTDTERELSLAPVFQVTDEEGNMVALSDFYGKPIVVNFWASWCGPCKSEMLDFQKAYETYGEEVNFLMVNMTDGFRETVETASDFVQKQGYTFPVYFDTESDAAVTYGIMSIPSTFFIDKEGYAVAYAQGAISGEVLQTGLDMIIE